MILNFISGLPRSGSTLLASILCQNPEFTASMVSPMGPAITKVREAMSPSQETHVLWDGGQQCRVVQSIFEAFYSNGPQVVFDTNRRWCADARLLAYIFPQCKIICCVRDPIQIIASFEKLFARYPVTMGTICSNNQSTTVFERVPALMATDGVVGYAYKAFRDAWFGPERDRLHLIEYQDLVDHPLQVLKYLHINLDLPWFGGYDFCNIKQIDGAAEFDKSLGVPGLHDLRPAVSVETDGNHPLPPDVLDKIPPAFWR